MIQLINSSYVAAKPTIIVSPPKYQWKDWMSPHLASIEGHQKSHHYVFKEEADGRIGFLYSGS